MLPEKYFINRQNVIVYFSAFLGSIVILTTLFVSVYFTTRPESPSRPRAEAASCQAQLYFELDCPTNNPNCGFSDVSNNAVKVMLHPMLDATQVPSDYKIVAADVYFTYDPNQLSIEEDPAILPGTQNNYFSAPDFNALLEKDPAVGRVGMHFLPDELDPAKIASPVDPIHLATVWFSPVRNATPGQGSVALNFEVESCGLATTISSSTAGSEVAAYSATDTGFIGKNALAGAQNGLFPVEATPTPTIPVSPTVAPATGEIAVSPTQDFAAPGQFCNFQVSYESTVSNPVITFELDGSDTEDRLCGGTGGIPCGASPIGQTLRSGRMVVYRLYNEDGSALLDGPEITVPGTDGPEEFSCETIGLTPSPTLTPTPTHTPTPSPTVVPTATLTPTPTVRPSATVTPGVTGTVTPTAVPSPTPLSCWNGSNLALIDYNGDCKHSSVDFSLWMDMFRAYIFADDKAAVLESKIYPNRYPDLVVKQANLTRSVLGVGDNKISAVDVSIFISLFNP